MRVLHVIATGRRGGGGTHLLGVLPELAKLGVQPSVAVGGDGTLASELEARGVPVDILNLPGPRPDPATGRPPAQLDWTGPATPDSWSSAA